MLSWVLARAPSHVVLWEGARGPAGASQGRVGAVCPGSQEKVGASAPAFGIHLELRTVFPCEPIPAVDGRAGAVPASHSASLTGFAACIKLPSARKVPPLFITRTSIGPELPPT